MKIRTKKETKDALLTHLIAELKKTGTRCGTGAEMLKIRAQR